MATKKRNYEGQTNDESPEAAMLPEVKNKKPQLTKEQAILLVDTHDVMQVMESQEEMELLKAHNPELLEAYEVLLNIANS